ncbi:MAG: hypothetical protein MUE69_23070 [Myxococcota bacterium]|nr:hypothetical protein [Myxococcota bacterium]
MSVARSVWTTCLLASIACGSGTASHRDAGPVSSADGGDPTLDAAPSADGGEPASDAEPAFDAGTDAEALAPDAGPVGPPLCTVSDLLPQTACPEGLSCDLSGYDDASASITVTCRPVLAAGGVGASCDSRSRCDRGLTCIGERCVRWCDPAVGCNAAEGGQCQPFEIQVTDTSTGATRTVSSGVSACLQPDPNVCDPRSVGAPCVVGTSCLITQTSGGVFETNCVSAGPGGFGSECASPADCGPRSLCTSVDGMPNRCREICVVGTECTAGGTCLGFSTPLVVAGVTYGTCR